VSKAVYTAEERETAREILRYFVDHPRAKDNLEGIIEWWLARPTTNRVVERALSLLLSTGLIIETRRRGSLPYYQVSPNRRAAALKMLREL